MSPTKTAAILSRGAELNEPCNKPQCHTDITLNGQKWPISHEWFTSNSALAKQAIYNEWQDSHDFPRVSGLKPWLIVD